MTRFEQNGSVNVWWFPKEFSQSHFGENQNSGRHSCTVISLLLADKLSKICRGLHRRPNELPPRSIKVFGDAINDGNTVYNRAITIVLGEMPNLNIPDALAILNEQTYLNFRLQEWFFIHINVNIINQNYNRMAAMRLARILIGGLVLFKKSRLRSNSRYLFAAIITDCRTVVFAFDIYAKVIAFFDSHQHGNSGAVIAQAPIDCVFEMTFWFVCMQQDIFASQSTLYEVSFLTPEAHRLPQLNRPDAPAQEFS